MKRVIKRAISWLASVRLPTPLNKSVGRFVRYAIESSGMAIISYATPEQIRVSDLIDKIREETEFLMSRVEAQQIFAMVKRTGKIEGDLAEVGVFRGASAKLICEAMRENGKQRNLYLFDTFEGLVNLGEIDRTHLQHGWFKSQFEDVSNYLKGYKGVFIYKGLFPATGEPINDKTFSFVHLDVDTYESTADSIKFFYPRMTPGGAIVSHDYTGLPGVRKAVDEFLADKPESVIELPGTQCLIIKL